MAYENILLDVSPEGTAVLTLNRPQKRNAFNAEVIAEMTDAFETLSKNPECRLVLIRGNGPVFSAGADLEWMRAAQHYSTSENAIGPRGARTLFVTAERFEADVAARIGLINHEVEDETAMEKLVEHYADLVYAASPAAIADTKALVADVTGEVIDASLGRMTAKRLAHRRVSNQGKEGLAAFLEKRKPNWAR
jgi:enoyl-CoA hydratase/carnithine racemase